MELSLNSLSSIILEPILARFIEPIIPPAYNHIIVSGKFTLQASFIGDELSLNSLNFQGN